MALGYAGGVERAGRAGRDPGDAATGLLLVAALGAGVILASDVFESGAAVDRLLFGTAIGLGRRRPGVPAAAAALAALGVAAARPRLDRGRRSTRRARPALGLPAARADLRCSGWWRSPRWPRSRRWARCW